MQYDQWCCNRHVIFTILCVPVGSVSEDTWLMCVLALSMLFWLSCCVTFGDVRAGASSNQSAMSSVALTASFRSGRCRSLERNWWVVRHTLQSITAPHTHTHTVWVRRTTQPLNHVVDQLDDQPFANPYILSTHMLASRPWSQSAT